MVINHWEDTELKEDTDKSLIEPVASEEEDLSLDLSVWGFVPWSRFGTLGRGIFGSTRNWLPSMDIFRREEKIIVKADLPGVDLADIEVSVENGRLIIRGHREESQDISEANFECMERATGEFYRAIKLPDNVLVGSIEATYENGVLVIEIPLAEPAKPKDRKVIIK
ncbi:MAG: Hsp20/alpha crystallin family protein [Chloroflexi bacterium]|nr:Hsp20/alpha crystallin family protein [Chloroflexota bacterium]